MLAFKKWAFRKVFFPTRYLRKWWTLVYRALGAHRYSAVPVRYRELTLDETRSTVGTLKWAPDGWRELGDAVGSPERTQWALNLIQTGHPQPNMAMDCDDFAAWCSACLQERYSPRVMSFYWLEGGSIKGHAVCLFKTDEGFGHIGNWGLYKPHGSVADLLERSLMPLPTGEERELVAWCVYKLDGLTPDKYGYTPPNF